MRSPDVTAFRAGSIFPLIKKELREVTGGRALWTMLLLLCPLVGYSYFQALSLYADASIAAQQSPPLAVSLSPLDGVLVPTFGAFYVAVTLLFPFVAIRVLGREKESGTLRMLVQLPYRPLTLAMAKTVAIILAWWIASVPILSALVLWKVSGGHLSPVETSNLFLGHFTYGLLIGAVALFAASISDSSATAAIIALAFTIGSWVLDFTLAGQPGLLEWFATLSLTQVLRPFEQGLLSFGLLIGVYIVVFTFVLLASIWLMPGTALRRKLLHSSLGITAAAAAIVAASQVLLAIDVTEDRRNSFPVADEHMLSTLKEPLRVTVHLAPEDPRYVDVRRNVLTKLQRVMPDVQILLASGHQLYGSVPTDPDYGLLEFVYGSRSDNTRSTSPREILPLIYSLAGHAPPEPIPGAEYPGYPVVASGRPALLWYFVVLPFCILIAWWWGRKPPQLLRIPTLKEVKS